MATRPGKPLPCLGAVEFAVAGSVEEAVPLVQGVQLDRACRVLGITDSGPVVEVRHLKAAVASVAPAGLDP